MVQKGLIVSQYMAQEYVIIVRLFAVLFEICDISRTKG